MKGESDEREGSYTRKERENESEFRIIGAGRIQCMRMLSGGGSEG
jgi:hypothetical protein